MLWLILGIILFLLVHSFTMMRGAREAAIVRLGETGYKIAYSVASLATLALLVWGYGAYRAGGYIPLWTPPRGMNHLSIALMLPAFVFLLAAYFKGEIARRLKHPMITSVKIWALAHLLANGDLGSMILFLSFLVWGVTARISMKRRPNQGVDVIPAGFSRNDVIAIVGGTVFWMVFMFKLHPLLIGVSVLEVGGG